MAHVTLSCYGQEDSGDSKGDERSTHSCRAMPFAYRSTRVSSQERVSKVVGFEGDEMDGISTGSVFDDDGTVQLFQWKCCVVESGEK